jgi:hypothetical protein
MKQKYHKNRRKPTRKAQAEILIDQTGRCCYCNISLFGRGIYWDHIIPFSYSYSNKKINFAATCEDCNNKKSDLIFRNEEDVILFCNRMICSHGSLGDGWPEETEDWQKILEDVVLGIKR